MYQSFAVGEGGGKTIILRPFYCKPVCTIGIRKQRQLFFGKICKLIGLVKCIKIIIKFVFGKGIL